VVYATSTNPLSGFCQTAVLLGSTPGDPHTYTGNPCGTEAIEYTLYPEITTPGAATPTPSGETSERSPTVTPTIPSPSLPTTTAVPESPPKSHTGAIAGGVVGGLAALALIGAAIFFYMKRRRRNMDMTPEISGDWHSVGNPPMSTTSHRTSQ